MSAYTGIKTLKANFPLEKYFIGEQMQLSLDLFH